MGRFEEVQADWKIKYRVPVVEDGFGDKYYIACLVFPYPGDKIAEIWQTQEPDEDDAKLLGQYIDFRIHKWYNSRWIRLMREKSLDIDSGVNTVSFRKSAKGWHYARLTWRSGPPFIPILSDPKQFPTLLEIIDHERSIGGKPDVRWEEYKTVNGIN